MGKKQKETQHSSITRFAWSLMASNVRGKPIAVKQTSKGVLPAAMDDKTAFSVSLIKNATDGSLTFVKHHDYDGRISPINPCPLKIPSGQWATFGHSGGLPGNSSDSIGAVVYRVTIPDGTQTQDCDWMMSWRNKYRDTPRKASSKSPLNSWWIGFELI